MNILTTKQAINARESLNLSQSKVANEIGLSRSYLSQFESGKRVLEDRWLNALKEFYANNGAVFDAEPKVADSEKNSQVLIMDGFVISGAVSKSQAENLLSEYYENSEKIEAESSEMLPRGFFGGLSHEGALEACSRSLALMARQYQIKQVLHGHVDAKEASKELDEESELDTVNDYIAALMQYITEPHTDEEDNSAEEAA